MAVNLLNPRSCPDDAWKVWLHDALCILRRGMWTWLPCEVLLNVLLAIIAYAAIRTPGLLGITILPVLAALEVPLLMLRTKMAQVLANGYVDLSTLSIEAWRDLKPNAAGIIRAMSVKALGAILVIAVAALVVVIAHTDSMPIQPPPSGPWVALSGGWNIMVKVWLLWNLIRMDGPAGFMPWLTIRHGLPTTDAFLLCDLAKSRNTKSLIALWLVFMALLVALYLAPASLMLIAPFWATLVHCAWADIFDDSPGLRTVRKAAHVPAGLPNALPASP